MSGLSKAYGMKKVLEGVSFTLHRGSCTALIGPNGAGKSTLVECIAGVRKMDGGQIKIDDRNVTQDIQAIRSLLYIQMQKQVVAKYARVCEVVDLMRKIYESPRSVAKILYTVGLSKNRRKYVYKLSEGERLRLEIAFSLIADRSIIIYDELTSGLDPLGRRAVYDILRQLKQESKTILYVTHYLEEIDLICNGVIVLNHAAITLFNSTKEILESQHQNRNQLFYDLYQGGKP